MNRPTLLITAGPTQEPIDPVRYISNRSSGKMGYALAEAAKKRGYQVILISGPTHLSPPKGIKTILVSTALDMHKAVMKWHKQADVIIKTAAVADYRMAKIEKKKIKKTKNRMTLTLVKNPDILKELGHKKRKDQILIGFAAETHQPLAHAKKKLIEKKCDWIVLNNVAQKGIGFGATQNKVTLLSKEGKITPLPQADKTKLAFRILQQIIPINRQS